MVSRTDSDLPFELSPGVTIDGHEMEGWFTAGYRPWRGGRRFVDDSGQAGSYAGRAPKEERFASMFDDYSAMTPIRGWLSDLDYRQLKETGTEKAKAKAALRHAVRAIEAIFPNRNIRFVEVTPLKDVIFEEHGIPVSIGMLSDGYRSAISWIGDLVRRLLEAFPNMADPLEAHGVVLIDEIDLHLHPSWQRTIVDQIRRVFPNLQFIVTTHSPFIAQEMTEKDKLIVLKREGDHVTASEDKGFVQGWRVDQILTSYLFGLDETRGKEVEVAEKSRRDLLDRRSQNGLSSVEKETLARVNDLIATIKSSPEEKIGAAGTTDAELRRAADDILKLLASRRSEPAKKR